MIRLICHNNDITQLPGAQELIRDSVLITNLLHNELVFTQENDKIRIDIPFRDMLWILEFYIRGSCVFDEIPGCVLYPGFMRSCEYIDAPRLESGLKEFVKKRIRNRSPQEIREYFGLRDDLHNTITMDSHPERDYIILRK